MKIRRHGPNHRHVHGGRMRPRFEEWQAAQERRWRAALASGDLKELRGTPSRRLRMRAQGRTRILDRVQESRP